MSVFLFYWLAFPPKLFPALTFFTKMRHYLLSLEVYTMQYNNIQHDFSEKHAVACDIEPFAHGRKLRSVHCRPSHVHFCTSFSLLSRAGLFISGCATGPRRNLHGRSCVRDEPIAIWSVRLSAAVKTVLVAEHGKVLWPHFVGVSHALRYSAAEELVLSYSYNADGAKTPSRRHCDCLFG